MLEFILQHSWLSCELLKDYCDFSFSRVFLLLFSCITLIVVVYFVMQTFLCSVSTLPLFCSSRFKPWRTAIRQEQENIKQNGNGHRKSRTGSWIETDV